MNNTVIPVPNLKPLLTTQKEFAVTVKEAVASEPCHSPRVDLLFLRFKEATPDENGLAEIVCNQVINYAIPKRKMRDVQKAIEADPSDMSIWSKLVGLAGDIDKDEPGQKALEIKPHVAFGGGFAAAVLGPIHAGCDQLDGGGIDDVDGLAKAMSDALAASSVGEARRKRLEMGEHGPEELLGQKRLALLVGMGKPVAAGRSRAPDARTSHFQNVSRCRFHTFGSSGHTLG